MNYYFQRLCFVSSVVCKNLFIYHMNQNISRYSKIKQSMKCLHLSRMQILSQSQSTNRNSTNKTKKVNLSWFFFIRSREFIIQFNTELIASIFLSESRTNREKYVISMLTVQYCLTVFQPLTYNKTKRVDFHFVSLGTETMHNNEVIQSWTSKST